MTALRSLLVATLFVGAAAIPRPGMAQAEFLPADAQPAPTEREIHLVIPSEGETRPDEIGAREQDDRDDDHEGFFARFTLGGGIGHVSGGRLGPEPGFRPMDSVSHTGPALGAAILFGGGVNDVAVAGELMYERVLTRLRDPSKISFSLYGLGITATAYNDDDWFLTAHLRWLMMMLWKSEIPCWVDRGDATMGPGLALTLGKEWFDDEEEDAVGIALQGNYAALTGNPELDYYSALLMLTLTTF